MNIRLQMTCGACPEQYDAFIGSERVGYLRLRHGYFSVRCPDPSGEEVFDGYPNGDGIFEPEERDYFLTKAKAAIYDWYTLKSEIGGVA